MDRVEAPGVLCINTYVTSEGAGPRVKAVNFRVRGEAVPTEVGATFTCEVVGVVREVLEGEAR